MFLYLVVAQCTAAFSYQLGVRMGSLEDLDEEERARFEELAVIPEDVDAPIATIAGLWERTGGLDEDLLERLAALSLLQGLDLGSRTVRLTDVLGRIADHKITCLEQLMPWRYAAKAA